MVNGEDDENITEDYHDVDNREDNEGGNDTHTRPLDVLVQLVASTGV